MTPLSVQLVVAAVAPSYILFVAVTLGVTVAAVMLAAVAPVVVAPRAAEETVAGRPPPVGTPAPTIPLRGVQLVVAAVAPSYVLFPAVTLAVTVAPVMSAVVVAFVDDST